MDRIRRGIWLPCSGSDLTQGRVTTLWRVSGSVTQQCVEINHVLDFLLDLDRRVDRVLEVAHKHKQKYLDPVPSKAAVSIATPQRKTTETHSLSANRYPMHDRFPLMGFPLRKVRTFDQRPGMAFVAEGGFTQRSGLINTRQ